MCIKFFLITFRLINTQEIRITWSFLWNRWIFWVWCALNLILLKNCLKRQKLLEIARPAKSCSQSGQAYLPASLNVFHGGDMSNLFPRVLSYPSLQSAREHRNEVGTWVRPGMVLLTHSNKCQYWIACSWARLHTSCMETIRAAPGKKRN